MDLRDMVQRQTHCYHMHTGFVRLAAASTAGHPWGRSPMQTAAHAYTARHGAHSPNVLTSARSCRPPVWLRPQEREAFLSEVAAERRRLAEENAAAVRRHASRAASWQKLHPIPIAWD
jgi:LmbE family N-acetylglucosaminyl deacetylase